MKIYSRKVRIKLFAFLAVCIGSCTSDFDEINTDPTLVTEDIIKPSMLLTSVLKYSVYSTYNLSIIAEYSGYYSNGASGSIFQSANWNDPYNAFYRNYIINTSEIIRLTAKDPRLINQTSMARILKVWLYSQLTDLYGDVPYFEAAQKVDQVINQPKYDTQKAIYTDMLKELKEASAALNEDPQLPSFGAADILMQGNVVKWRRFANSLRLRLAMRIRYADENLAKQHIQEVINAPLIDDNSFNVFLKTLNGSDTRNRNPQWNDPINNYPQSVSFTVTETLKMLKDPRIRIFIQPAPDSISGYRGRPIAALPDEKGYGSENSASQGQFFREAVYPIMVMNAAEVFLLRAEAALFKFSTENAQTMFTNGIASSLLQYQVNEAEKKSYLSSEQTKLAGTDEQKLEQIILQKFLANYYQIYEGYAEFRRTGYPKIWTGSDKGSTGGEIPRRLTYPLDEYTKNESNIKKAASALSKGDTYMSRIWWDAKPGLPFHHPRQGKFPPEMY
ncbi:SusD/RagB family nutrient-binding outer membrane lipoprotein [Dyadobacter tibetensis]|uniref:SusD/RagB family nutrient-binding outer membrane lipoprotein n=1 Tax=Dyadobacter tibetensis TaxID=1211851 RepID=UPI0004703B48|nr:SusD/RagB family nutrient-binding outer membrane lipoprotein [Dyadobacter tibetensis]